MTYTNSGRRADTEIREVSIEPREAGGIAVVEESAGEITQAIYDADSHRHAVIIGEEELPRVADALGAGNAACGLSLEAYFAHPGRHLSDLMDRLDRADIPFAYVAEYEGRALFRPQAT